MNLNRFRKCWVLTSVMVVSWSPYIVRAGEGFSWFGDLTVSYSSTRGDASIEKKNDSSHVAKLGLQTAGSRGLSESWTVGGVADLDLRFEDKKHGSDFHRLYLSLRNKDLKFKLGKDIHVIDRYSEELLSSRNEAGLIEVGTRQLEEIRYGAFVESNPVYSGFHYQAGLYDLRSSNYEYRTRASCRGIGVGVGWTKKDFVSDKYLSDNILRPLTRFIEQFRIGAASVYHTDCRRPESEIPSARTFAAIKIDLKRAFIGYRDRPVRMSDILIPDRPVKRSVMQKERFLYQSQDHWSRVNSKNVGRIPADLQSPYAWLPAWSVGFGYLGSRNEHDCTACQTTNAEYVFEISRELANHRWTGLLGFENVRGREDVMYGRLVFNLFKKFRWNGSVGIERRHKSGSKKVYIASAQAEIFFGPETGR